MHSIDLKSWLYVFASNLNILLNYMPLWYQNSYIGWLSIYGCSIHGSIQSHAFINTRPWSTLLAYSLGLCSHSWPHSNSWPCLMFPRSCSCPYHLYCVPLGFWGYGSFISLHWVVMLLPLLSYLFLLHGFLLANYQLFLCLHTYDKYWKLICLWVTFGGCKSLHRLYDEC